MEEQQSTILPDISLKSRASRPESKIAKPPPGYKSKSPMGRKWKNSKLNPPLPVLYEVSSKLEVPSVYQLPAKETESKCKQEVAPASVHQLPAIETGSKDNEPSSEIQSKSPTVEKTRTTARRRSRLPVRNKQKLGPKSPMDKTWPNSKLKTPLPVHYYAGLDIQRAVPVSVQQLPEMQPEIQSNYESSSEIESKSPAVKKTRTTARRRSRIPVRNKQKLGPKSPTDKTWPNSKLKPPLPVHYSGLGNQEVASVSVHLLPAMQPEIRSNEPPPGIESKSPKVKKTRTTARRRSRIPVRNKQEFGPKSPTDKTWPNSKLKPPLPVQYYAGLDSQGAVPVPGDQLPAIQSEIKLNESPPEIISKTSMVKTRPTRKRERRPLLPDHKKQNSGTLETEGVVPCHQQVPANPSECKSNESPSEINCKSPTTVKAWTVAKCRPPLPVYNYEKLRRQGVVPVPVHQLPPIPEIVPYRSTSEQLDFHFPGWNDPKRYEANSAYHVARSERTNTDIGEIPQLIFNCDRNKYMMSVEFDLRNLTNRPIMFRITGDDRLIVLPSFGSLHPYETLMIQVNVDYREYGSSMKTFFKQKLVIETLFTEVYFRTRSMMVEYIKNHYDRVQMMFLDRFMIYRKPKDAVFICDEHEAFRMLEDFENFDPAEKMLREKLEKEAAEPRNNGNARRLILEAFETMMLEYPEPMLSNRTLRALVIVSVVTCYVYGIWMFCHVGTPKSKFK